MGKGISMTDQQTKQLVSLVHAINTVLAHTFKNDSYGTIDDVTIVRAIGCVITQMHDLLHESNSESDFIGDMITALQWADQQKKAS